MSEHKRKFQTPMSLLTNQQISTPLSPSPPHPQKNEKKYSHYIYYPYFIPEYPEIALHHLRDPSGVHVHVSC